MPELLTVGSLFSGIQSAASTSASSAPACPSRGRLKLNLLRRRSCASTGLKSRTTATCEPFELTPHSPSMCSVAAGHAKHGQRPQGVVVRTQTCGQKYCDLLKHSSHVGSWLRTCLEHYMASTGWPVISRTMTTPLGLSIATLRYQKDSAGVCEASSWPTPTATANHWCPSMTKWPAYAALQKACPKQSPVLWEWQMGFPEGWTDLECLETRSRRKSRKPSEEQS